MIVYRTVPVSGGGILVDDECGVCDGDNSSCADCAGTPNGDATVDNCGTCDSESSNDCEQDCAGVWGGDAEVSDFYYDLDGDGLGAGNAVFLCDAYVPSIMVANNDDSDDDCYSNVHDCLGDCDGTAVVDDCGVCNFITTIAHSHTVMIVGITSVIYIIAIEYPCIRRICIT